LSERFREGERLLNDATEAQLDGDAQLTSNQSIVSLENGVCEPGEAPCPIIRRKGLVPSPAHPSNRLIAQLNTNWRVVDDPLQWILQRRKGNPRKKNSGWQDRSFCTTREGLLRCVCETCGEVDDEALAHIRALPEFRCLDELRKTSTFMGRFTVEGE
jgi:hypothetical protein